MTRLGDYISEFSARNHLDESIPVYSVTNDRGFCSGYFNKDVASKDKTTYKIVPHGYFAYNPSRINVGSIAWQNSAERVIVSPLYVVFKVSDKLDRQYLLHYLKSDVGMTFIKAHAAGSVRDSLKFSDLKELPIHVVPLEKQRKIARTLDKLDALISQCHQQANSFDTLVKSQFVEMFGGYTETAKLSDVATISGGLTKSTKRDKLPLRMPYLRVANVSFASIDVSEMLDIGLTDEEYSKTLLQRGDLLFVEGNGSPDQIGRVAIWENQVVSCVHQNHLIKSRFNKGLVIPSFAMHYFMSHRGREQIKGKAVSTSGLYTLSVSKISNLMLPVPPLDLQEHFAAFVAQVDKSKVEIQKAIDQLEILKKSLMQQYFG